MKRLPTANGPSALPAINQRRLMRDLNAIGRIGIGNRGGVTRLVFSIKELRSRQVLIHLMRQAGLKIYIDAIGNIFGRLEGRDAKAPAVLSGSHLDTVIHGGKYDGPVGVIGALEAVRTIGENKIPIRSPLEVVCFVGEESSRFGFSTLGSSLVAGEVHAKDLANAVDAQGTKLADVLSSLGIAGEKPARPRPRSEKPQGLSRTAHRTRADLRSHRQAHRPGHLHRRTEPVQSHLHRPGRSLRHDADGDAQRRPGRRGAADRIHRNNLPQSSRPWPKAASSARSAP